MPDILKFLLILAAAALVVYAASGLFRIDVTRYRVRHPKLPRTFKGMKILLLADLHGAELGKNNEKLIQKCAAQKPNMIFFAGDLISRNEKDLTPKIEFMKRLTEIAPVYYSLGNHEVDNYNLTGELIEGLSRAGVISMVNTRRILEKDGGRVQLYGCALESHFYENLNGGYSHLPPVTKPALDDRMGMKASDDFVMLIAHNPMGIQGYADWGADIVFSGHVHGGIVRIPFLHRGLLSPERKFFPKYSEGVHDVDGTKLIVSRGLGKFRLFNNPEIVVISLT